MNNTERNLLIGGVSVVLLFILSIVYWCTCVPTYNVPVYKEIETNQTAFLIPMDGDTGSQTQFASADFLKEKKVAAQRVQIPRRWVQTGRLPASGTYVDTVRLVVVDRSPVVREWTQTPITGSSPNDDSIAVTSQDGIKFTIGFTVTAYIPEDKTADFLFWYRGDQLANVIDKEVRARVSSVITEFCVTFTMDHLRGHQGEIVKAVKEDTQKFFNERGIVITSMGFVGGFHYENKLVQDAIDKTVADQQLKVSAEAKRASQEVENQTIRLAAEGKAEAIKIEAKAKADAIRAEAEATAFQLEQATKDKTFYLSIRTMELEMARLRAWDGKLPSFLMGTGNNQPPFLFNLPVPVEMKK